MFEARQRRDKLIPIYLQQKLHTYKTFAGNGYFLLHSTNMIDCL